MPLHLTATQFLAGIGVVLILLTVWRASARRARAAADTARAGARLLSLTGRVVVTAGAIVGVQWVVIAYPIGNRWVLLAVLALPALFASYTLTRALTVTTVDMPQARRGRRDGRR
jgi:hypothetical protein